MAKEVFYRSFCDYPGCRDEHPEGQQTQDIEVWVYTPGRGRKPDEIRVEMCEAHVTALKDLFAHLQKFKQATE